VLKETWGCHFHFMRPRMFVLFCCFAVLPSSLPNDHHQRPFYPFNPFSTLNPFTPQAGRRAAVNALMEAKGNVRVLCRVRDPSSGGPGKGLAIAAGESTRVLSPTEGLACFF